VFLAAVFLASLPRVQSVIYSAISTSGKQGSKGAKEQYILPAIHIA